ncbi:hypothetical protein [Moorena bouillonii]|uniref:Uncharacterized protein n=1 Tax=Moorena bouillonii PNG TaxID=568701 RepID=A0A1U7N5X3_9CYAN|nr:hypothetical protein [Moorena bouillonii]OLT61341.1 hypothetical protein BJP37_22335 [Moorena bouillonii PNG]
MEKVVKKLKMTQQKSEFSYWQKQSYKKRLEALEIIRKQYHQYQYNNAQPRLQRVYTIIKR